MKVEVKDTGVGIGKEDIDKLFKFFGKISKTKEINKGGMGLGLTISKMILQQLGGTIGIKSEAEKGSNFFFTIPLGKLESESCGPIDSLINNEENEVQYLNEIREKIKEGQYMSPRKATDLKEQIALLNRTQPTNKLL